MKKLNSLTIRNQIKRYIKARIEKGELQTGQAVPSVRDLSAFLNVNRNTIAHAYRELIEEGVLITVRGSGTFVETQGLFNDRKELRQILEEAVSNSYKLGFNTDDITDVFFSCVSSYQDYSSGKVVVVDCNEPLIEYLRQQIAEDLKIQTEGVLIQEIENHPGTFKNLFGTSVLVVCGFNHVQELLKALPMLEEKVVAVTLQLDTVVLDAVMNLPAGTKVGYVCVNRRSAETIYNSAVFSGHKRLTRIIAGLNDLELLNKAMDECDIVYITSFANERVALQARPGQKLISVDITLSSDNMELIRKGVVQNARDGFVRAASSE